MENTKIENNDTNIVLCGVIDMYGRKVVINKNVKCLDCKIRSDCTIEWMFKRCKFICGKNDSLIYAT